MKKIKYHGQELLPIKSDIVFKVIFGKPENVDILAKFLEAILDIEIENPEDIKLSRLSSCEYFFISGKKPPIHKLKKVIII